MLTKAHGIVIEDLLTAVQKAGEAILKVYACDFEVEYKGDHSPLTEADRHANAVLVEFLRTAYPEIPVISEEMKAADYEVRKKWNRFWLLDPLDGTKEFIKKNGEFTVNVALVEDGVPILGVVYQPTTEIFYLGFVGEGSWKLDQDGSETQLFAQPHYQSLENVRVVASRSHLTPEVEEFVESLKSEGKKVEFLTAGSSLKLCLVAEGAADVYPRFGPTMEWDTGAAHAVALAAGRRVLDAETGGALIYNKEDLLNPYFIVE